MKTITRIIYGQKVEFEPARDCDKCGAKKAVKRVDSVHFPFYPQPCPKCRESKEWQELQAKTDRMTKGTSEAERVRKNTPAAVYEGGGRQIVVNQKGDVIKNVPYRDRKVGVKDEARKI